MAARAADGSSVQYATTSIGSVSTLYRAPEPVLTEMDKAQRVPKKGVKKCMCCDKSKFGLFAGKHNCRSCGQVVCDSCSLRRHPMHKDMLICRRCYSRGMVESYHMQESGWYHGPLTRQEAEARLQSKEALPGDYLVRESGGLDGFLALSVRFPEGVTHYLINIHHDLFFVGTARLVPGDNDELFSSIEEALESPALLKICKLRRAVVVDPPDDEKCPRCKFVNPSADELFCHGCGTRLNSTAAQRKLYYDLGLAMRDPNFTKSAINNPGYQEQAVEEPRDGVVNAHYGKLVEEEKVARAPNALYLKSLDGEVPSATGAAIGADYASNPGNFYAAGHDEEESMAIYSGPIMYHTELARGNVTLGPEIGKGYFGKLHRGTLVREDGAPVEVAVKVLRDSAKKNEEEAFCNEIMKLGMLSHAHIAASFGGCTVGKPLMLVLELATEGTLEALVRAEDPRLDNKTKISLLLDFALGLEYIAGMKLVHRDIAARSCSVMKGPGGLLAKVSDMGLARELVEDYYVSTVGADIARRWAAPEVLTYGTFTTWSDVWAFGITVYEVFQQRPGTVPFFTVAKVAELAAAYASPEGTTTTVTELCKDLSRSCPGEIRELLKSILVHDKHARPAFAAIANLLTDAREGTARWDFPRDNLRLLKELGHGAFGKVYKYRATNLGPGSIEVAVKTCTDRKNAGRFLEEIEMMKTLRHPHIVRMLAACVSGGDPWMVLEYVAEGSLDHFLRRPKVNLTPTELQTILFQVATAMAYIVDRQLVHRDLSARNCLISLPVNIKLADFGLARETEESLYEQASNTNIPVRWTAPECFRTRTFSEQTDVFGFGTLAWEVYTYPWDRKKPYRHAVPLNELTDPQFIMKLRSDALPPLKAIAPPPFMTPLISDTIERCRAAKASARPIFAELVSSLSPFSLDN